MHLQVIFFFTSLHLSASFPMKLLRVPKIYNALITTNQKLLPSEAVPASTGPVFQPVPFSGDPILLNPEAFSREQPGEEPGPFQKSDKMPAPVVFYPRYNVYHQLPQSVFPFHNVFQPPPIVVPVERSQPDVPEPKAPVSTEAPVVSEEEEEKEEETPSAAMPPARPAFGFVTNNSPTNLDIPNVPPPPPPVGAPRPPEEVEE